MHKIAADILIVQILLSHFKKIFPLILLRLYFPKISFSHKVVDFVCGIGLRDPDIIRELIDRRPVHSENHFHTEGFHRRQP